MLLPISSYSQETSILEFRGIPIQGTLNAFVAQLTQIGYEKKYEESSSAILKGKFIGHDVLVAIQSTPRTNLVWKVSVICQDDNAWTSLKSLYQETKELYLKKYTYDNSFEFFVDPYYEGDGYEISAFKLEKAHYITFYKEGIYVRITKRAKLEISYENSENAKIAEQEQAASDLNDI